MLAEVYHEYMPYDQKREEIPFNGRLGVYYASEMCSTNARRYI
jgi:hypothetical protein